MILIVTGVRATDKLKARAPKAEAIQTNRLGLLLDSECSTGSSINIRQVRSRQDELKRGINGTWLT